MEYWDLSQPGDNEGAITLVLEEPFLTEPRFVSLLLQALTSPNTLPRAQVEECVDLDSPWSIGTCHSLVTMRRETEGTVAWSFLPGPRG